MPFNAVEAATVASSADFQSLEEKILRTIELLKVERAAKATAEKASARLREQLTEREEVRTRVEKMLGQIESLTAEG